MSSVYISRFLWYSRVTNSQTDGLQCLTYIVFTLRYETLTSSASTKNTMLYSQLRSYNLPFFLKQLPARLWQIYAPTNQYQGVTRSHEIAYRLISLSFALFHSRDLTSRNIFISIDMTILSFIWIHRNILEAFSQNWVREATRR